MASGDGGRTTGKSSGSGGGGDDVRQVTPQEGSRPPHPRLALFGASTMGRQCLEELRAQHIPVECFLDNDAKKWGTSLDGLEIRQPSPAVIASLDYIWLTSLYANQIERQLEDLGAAAKSLRTRREVMSVARPTAESTPAADATQAAPPSIARSSEVAIVIADEGWILERCAREIESRLPYVRVSTTPIPDAKLTYYVNYTARRSRVSPIEVAFFTHVEERAPSAARRFFDIGRDVDVAVSMSARYAKQLREQGVRDVRVITPGVDLGRFQPAVRIAVVGRTYHTGRKGEDLVRAVIGEPHIEWHFTGSGWPHPGKKIAEADLPAFYRSMDYVLVPAHYEGGPMSVLEALACGVEVIAPNVGFVDEYPHIEFEAGNAEDLRRVLREVVEIRLARRRSVESRSWAAWAAGHDRLFRELLPELASPNLAMASSAMAAPATATDAAPAVAAPPVEPAAPAVLAAPAVIAARSTSRPRVLLAMHAPETVTPSGGPAVRVPKMREALKAHGIDAEVNTEELPDASRYDLVHVFNVWDAEAAKQQILHLKSFGRPIVFSPIALDLEESLWAAKAILPLVGSGRPADEIDRDLEQVLKTPMEVRRALGGAITEFWRKWPEKVRELTSLADHLIVLSDHELSVLDRMGALNTPYSRVHNGVDPVWSTSATPDAFAAHLGIRDYALCVGSIELRKNQLMLARALRGTGIDLVLIGGTAQPDYASVVKEIGGDRVHLVGRLGHEDPLLASAYAGARLFVLPSWCEGAPLSALEAASFGLPLVLSDRSSEREYFGPLASYCDPSREDDMRARVLEAWATGASEDRGARRARVRSWIESSLTWDHAARQTAQAYARVLNARTPNRFVPPPDRTLDVSASAAPLPGCERVERRTPAAGADRQESAPSALPFPDGAFDGVVALDGFGRLPQPEILGTLREWARVVRPGGRIDITTADREQLARRDPAPGRKDCESGVELDEESLAQALTYAGFGDIERHEPFSELRLVASRLPEFARGTAVQPPSRGPLAPRTIEPPPALLWDGPVFNVNGYASLARHVMRALVPVGVSISFTRRHDDGAGRAECVNWRDAWIWHRVLRRRPPSGVLVSCGTAADRMGNSVFDLVRDMYPNMQAYIGFSMFETDRLPGGWASACKAMDEIWVPSHFVRDVFERAGVPAAKLQVFPLGLDASRYDRDVVEPMEIPGRRGFTFLSIFDWTLRKGWDVLIEAYGRSFRASDDVCLVLRTSGRADESPSDAIAGVFDRLGIPEGDRPSVILLDAPVGEDEMPRLYRAADAFVLPTRGEGWGLPLMEAMASSLPTIATRWGGQLDFMDDTASLLIDIEGLVPVDADHARRYPYYDGGHRWAQPSIEHTATLMRKVFDDQEYARALGRRGRDSIRANWTPERMVQWVVDRLEHVGGKTVRPEGAEPPLRAGVLFELGKQAFWDNRFEDARDRFEGCLALHAEHTGARAWLAFVTGRIEERAGRHEEAARAYESACALNRHWPLATYNLASAWVRIGQAAKAAPVFTKLAKEAGEAGLRGGSHFHLARIHEAEGRVSEAIGHAHSCQLEIPGHQGAAALVERLLVAQV